MKKDLVSIITPCYNTASIIHRLFDSVLAQDYPMIEMFVVNDGSTDNSEEIINAYIPRFAKKGYLLTYIFQKNQGQSSAINNALKYVNGEFLAWPDSDDYYSTNKAISTFVETFHKLGDEYAIVRCLPTYMDESDLHVKKSTMITPMLSNSEQFNICLFEDDFIWPPGNYMVKMSCLDRVISKRSIFTHKFAGQNYQILLPLFYSYKCFTINDSFFAVLERQSSHSRGMYSGIEKQILKTDVYKETIIATIQSMTSMQESEKEKYLKKLINKWSIQRIRLYFNHGCIKNAWQQILDCRKNGIAIPIPLTLKVYLFLLFRK